MSIYQTPLSAIEKDILIKTEVGETYEFRIKTELENLHLVEETDAQAPVYNWINATTNLMYKILNEIRGSTDHKKRLSKAHRIIKLSTLLLQRVEVYESNFNIYPDGTTQDVTQIGSLIWYRGVLGIIGGLETILIAESYNPAADSETVSIRLEKNWDIKLKWQQKAQSLYPGAH